MIRLIDTNILVYRVDPRDRKKQEIATEVLRRGLAEESVVIPHQALVEFVAAASRPRAELGDQPLLERPGALLEAESLVAQFPVLFADRNVMLTAIRGCVTYQLSWFDAHLWAFAEANGIREILSEDFEHGRHYGNVRVVDPFMLAAGGVQDLPPLWRAGDETR